MIIREEHDRFRLQPPQPYYYPWYRPMSAGIGEDIPAVGEMDRIIFTPEYDDQVLEPNVYVKVWDVPWRWVCQTCYMASGGHRAVFKTDWVRREDLGERGDRDRGGWCTPALSQQDQIREHAKQHEIMYAWAKGLK